MSKTVETTAQCRDTNELNTLVQVMLSLALAEIRKQGVTPLVVETYRTKERQYSLYGQGRTVALCKSAGMPAAKAKQYAKPSLTRCTWTLNSIHIERKAVDVIPMRKGKAIWNASDMDTKVIINVMQKYGFEAGANWKNSPDSPHYQVKGTFNKVFSKNKNTVYVTKSIQRALKKLGYYEHEIDGDWKKATTKAINKFRKDNGWLPTGKLGKKAFKKLMKAL